jgi:hypothetical protein
VLVLPGQFLITALHVLQGTHAVLCVVLRMKGFLIPAHTPCLCVSVSAL